MRKQDGEPPSNLETCSRELRRKRAVKKGLPKKTVSVVAAERPEDNQLSPRYKELPFPTTLLRGLLIWCWRDEWNFPILLLGN